MDERSGRPHGGRSTHAVAPNAVSRLNHDVVEALESIRVEVEEYVDALREHRQTLDSYCRDVEQFVAGVGTVARVAAIISATASRSVCRSDAAPYARFSANARSAMEKLAALGPQPVLVTHKKFIDACASGARAATAFLEGRPGWAWLLTIPSDEIGQADVQGAVWDLRGSIAELIHELSFTAESVRLGEVIHRSIVSLDDAAGALSAADCRSLVDAVWFITRPTPWERPDALQFVVLNFRLSHSLFETLGGASAGAPRGAPKTLEKHWAKAMHYCAKSLSAWVKSQKEVASLGKALSEDRSAELGKLLALAEVGDIRASATRPDVMLELNEMSLAARELDAEGLRLGWHAAFIDLTALLLGLYAAYLSGDEAAAFRLGMYDLQQLVLTMVSAWGASREHIKSAIPAFGVLGSLIGLASAIHALYADLQASKPAPAILARTISVMSYSAQVVLRVLIIESVERLGTKTGAALLRSLLAKAIGALLGPAQWIMLALDALPLLALLHDLLEQATFEAGRSRYYGHAHLLAFLTYALGRLETEQTDNWSDFEAPRIYTPRDMRTRRSRSSTKLSVLTDVDAYLANMSAILETDGEDSLLRKLWNVRTLALGAFRIYGGTWLPKPHEGHPFFGLPDVFGVPAERAGEAGYDEFVVMVQDAVEVGGHSTREHQRRAYSIETLVAIGVPEDWAAPMMYHREADARRMMEGDGFFKNAMALNGNTPPLFGPR